jgi:hypothetical protein
VRHYRIGGLLVECAFALQGAIPATPAGAADVVVALGAAPAELAGPVVEGPNWVAAGDAFLLSVPTVARYLIVGGREIRIDLEPGVELADAQVYLLGTAFGILQHQRGRMVLHASAVAVGDKAALFAGPSGAGKSTLAAAFNRRGYPCVSDDVCGIDFSSGGPVVLPDGRMLKLWADTVSHLEMGERQGPSIRRAPGWIATWRWPRSMCCASPGRASHRASAGWAQPTPPNSCAATPIGRASSPSSASKRPT